MGAKLSELAYTCFAGNLLFIHGLNSLESECYFMKLYQILASNRERTSIFLGPFIDLLSESKVREGTKMYKGIYLVCREAFRTGSCVPKSFKF